MDNLAHSLVGLAASKAGLEKLSPWATPVCVVAANAPDIDFLSALSGDRWIVLHYHRGITHSIAGTIFLAVAITSVFYAIDLFAARVRHRPRRLQFRGLLIAALITGATHPLLDWTNNYGVRLLLPWSGKWSYGDLVFVVDPVLWIIFGAACFLLTANSRLRLSLWSFLAALLTLLVVYATTIARGVEHPGLVLWLWVGVLIALLLGYRFKVGLRYGNRLAIVAFLTLFAYWGVLSVFHARALTRAEIVGAAEAGRNHEQVLRLAAMPTLLNPFRWRCVVETDHSVYRFDLLLLDDEEHDLVRFAKPDQGEARFIATAAEDRRARIFFEFARFPVSHVAGEDCATQTLVQLADLRYTEPGKARGTFSLELPVDCPDQTKGSVHGR
jgi:inner membrane protein